MDKLDFLFICALQLQKSGIESIKDIKYDEQDIQICFPFMINLSLSSELLIKYIIQKEDNRRVGGHKLHKLYEELPNKAKSLIFMEVNRNLIFRDPIFRDLGFIKSLEIHSDIFYQYRYAHEFIDQWVGTTFNYEFIKQFNRFLYYYANKLRNQN